MKGAQRREDAADDDRGDDRQQHYEDYRDCERKTA